MEKAVRVLTECLGKGWWSAYCDRAMTALESILKSCKANFIGLEFTLPDGSSPWSTSYEGVGSGQRTEIHLKEVEFTMCQCRTIADFVLGKVQQFRVMQKPVGALPRGSPVAGRPPVSVPRARA